MSALSDYLEQGVLNHLLRAAALPTLNASNYVALFTVAPSDSGGGTEVSGGGYARVAISRGTGSWDAPSSGATQNTGSIDFGTTSGAWGTVGAFGIFDASSSGNLLLHGAVSPSKTIGNGDPVSYAAGALDLTFSQTTGGGFSSYLRDGLINWLLRGVAFPTLNADVYFSLHTGAPGLTGASEVSGGSYARVAKTRNGTNFNAASTGGLADNATQVTFPSPSGANWGTITAAGLWDTSSAGNFLWALPMAASKTVNDGDQAPYIAVGDADFTLA